MSLRFSLWPFTGFLIGLEEAVLRTFLPGSWIWFLPVLPIGVFLLGSGRRREAYAVAVVGGLLADLFAIESGFLKCFFYPLALFVVDFVGTHTVTNRSLYSLVALVLLGRLVDWLSGVLLALIAGPFLSNPPRIPPFEGLWRTGGWDVLLITALFLGGLLFSRLLARRAKKRTSIYGLAP